MKPRVRGRSARRAYLEDAVGAALGVHHHVRQERVVPGLGERELHEAALRGGERQRLATTGVALSGG